MRFQFSPGFTGAVISLLALALVFGAGCSKDNGGEPAPPPTCAISDVNTSLSDSWLTGENVNIRWSGNGVPSTVVIELLKGGEVVETIAPAAPNKPAGFYPWKATTGGQPNGSDFGIRVTGTDAGSCTDQVTGLTIIEVGGCGITFTADLGTDPITAGESFEITWDSFHTSGKVDIELWTTGVDMPLGDRVGIIAFDLPDNGSHTWTVDSFHNGTYGFYRYVIRDAAVGDCEVASSPFSMIDDDNCSIIVGGIIPGKDYHDSEVVNLGFSQTNGNGIVDLQLFAGNVFVGHISTNVPIAAGFAWTVSDFGYTGTNNLYIIRAFDTTDRYCDGESVRFTILR